MIEYEYVPGSYKLLTLTSTSAAHVIDTNKTSGVVFVSTTNDVHIEFGIAGVDTTVTDPQVLAASPSKPTHIPKNKGHTHIAVLAPENTGTMKIWLGKRIQRGVS